MKQIEFDRCSLSELPLRESLAAGLRKDGDFQVLFSQPDLHGPGVEDVLGLGWRRPDDGHFLGANSLMLPELWSEGMGPPEPLSLSVMHEALVFGGLITQRTESTHREGQALLRSQGEMTRDSFGYMDGNTTWSADILEQDEHGKSWRYIGPREASRLQGDYYFVGNVHHHFGHVMLEGLSRLWAMQEVGQVAPDLRYLVYESGLQPFAVQLLALAGIPEDRIVFASPATAVERLFVPSTAMRTHRWITSAMGDIWGRMVGACGAPATGASRKIYLSRRSVGNRPLENEEQLEELLKSRGFEIQYPERMSIRDQVRMASEARVLAGPVGSQMYLAGFQSPGSAVLVVAPRNFYLKDDLLLAAAKGHRLAVCFGPSINFREEKSDRHWSVDVSLVSKRLDGLLEGI